MHMPKPVEPTELVTDYPRVQVYDRWAKTHGFFVIRREKRIYAVSSICTHRHCTLDGMGSEMVCPCHGSRFALNGIPGEGPAKRPLPRLEISLNGQGRIIVDPVRQFDEPRWDMTEAFISI